MNLSTDGLCLAAGAPVDLHLHTIASDGRWTLDLLLDHLLSEQFALAAVTDHDRVDIAASVQQAALQKGLPVLVGVEMTCAWKGELVDMLCYGFDPRQNALEALAQGVLARQQENTREVFANIERRGYTFPPGALADLLAIPSAQQPHAIAGLLRQHGYGLGEPSAGRIVLDAGVDFATSEPAAVVEAARRSGAVCLLAHPGRGDGFVDFDFSLLDEFRQEAPVDGLEVFHTKHSAAQSEMYLEYANRHRLLVSAGSDSHSPDKPPIQYPAELSRALLERLGIPVQ